MAKRLAIMGGGDWADASICLLNLPDDVDVDKAEAEYRTWKSENWTTGNYVGHEGRFLNFADWLRVFKNATDSDVIEHWDMI